MHALRIILSCGLNPDCPCSLQPTNRRLGRSIRDARSQSQVYVLRSAYSRISAIAPDPWIIGIDVYSANDLPLGAFLELFCFGYSWLAGLLAGWLFTCLLFMCVLFISGVRMATTATPRRSTRSSVSLKPVAR